MSQLTNVGTRLNEKNNLSFLISGCLNVIIYHTTYYEPRNQYIIYVEEEITASRNFISGFDGEIAKCVFWFQWVFLLRYVTVSWTTSLKLIFALNWYSVWNMVSACKQRTEIYYYSVHSFFLFLLSPWCKMKHIIYIDHYELLNYGKTFSVELNCQQLTQLTVVL